MLDKFCSLLTLRKVLPAVFSAILLFCLAAIGAAQKQPDYVLGAEDLITVTVLNHIEYSGDIFIPPGGEIGVSGIGFVRAEGLTPKELARVITEKLRARLKDPEVTVVLKMPRIQRIYVIGAVQRPGFVDGKAGWRVTECLSAAGGLNPDLQPNDVTVTVQHVATGQKETVSLGDAVKGADGKNCLVYTGDVVSFDSPELMTVYITGFVRLPGMYRIRKDHAGLMEGISLAGGIGNNSSILPNVVGAGPGISNVTITHLNGEVERVDLAPVVLRGEDRPVPILRAGDLVNIPEAQGKIAVLGWVKLPGFYNLPDGRPTLLSEALALAGGHDNHRARLSRVVIVRKQGGKELHLVFNLGRFLTKADVSQNPVVLNGDLIYVPETDSIDWIVILQGIYSATGLGNLFR